MLQDQLPSKEEHVILVRLSPIQRALYTEFMKRFREAGNSGWLGLNPLKAFCVCCKVSFRTSQEISNTTNAPISINTEDTATTTIVTTTKQTNLWSHILYAQHSGYTRKTICVFVHQVCILVEVPKDFFMLKR